MPDLYDEVGLIPPWGEAYRLFGDARCDPFGEEESLTYPELAPST